MNKQKRIYEYKIGVVIYSTYVRSIIRRGAQMNPRDLEQDNWELN